MIRQQPPMTMEQAEQSDALYRSRFQVRSPEPAPNPAACNWVGLCLLDSVSFGARDCTPHGVGVCVRRCTQNRGSSSSWVGGLGLGLGLGLGRRSSPWRTWWKASSTRSRPSRPTKLSSSSARQAPSTNPARRSIAPLCTRMRARGDRVLGLGLATVCREVWRRPRSRRHTHTHKPTHTEQHCCKRTDCEACCAAMLAYCPTARRVCTMLCRTTATGLGSSGCRRGNGTCEWTHATPSSCKRHAHARTHTLVGGTTSAFACVVAALSSDGKRREGRSEREREKRGGARWTLRARPAH